MHARDGHHEHDAVDAHSPHQFHQAVAFKLRGLLMVPPLVALFFWHRWEWEHEPGVWTVGLSLLVLGMAVRVWSQRHLKYRLRQKRALATSGPYALMRNPVYIGNMLILASVCVLCELPWAIPFVVGWAALVYHFAIRFEEGRLLARHGDAYADYRSSVPRWWPRRPAREPANGALACSWLEAARVEWQCLAFPLIALVKEVMH
jgi:protein-S-isoprenylcysteine O-methyltransferase Ste14